jgi:hypothetical protein
MMQYLKWILHQKVGTIKLVDLYLGKIIQMGKTIVSFGGQGCTLMINRVIQNLEDFMLELLLLVG